MGKFVLVNNCKKERIHLVWGWKLHLKFKFQEKLWEIDATKDCLLGQLINHSKKLQNIKSVLKVKEGKPLIRFIALRNIDKDEELLHDYSDSSKLAKTYFPWLKK